MIVFDRDKIRRFIASIGFAVAVGLIAEKLGPVYAIAFLAYFVFGLSIQVQSIIKVLPDVLTQYSNKMYSTLKENFQKMKEELPAKIHDGLKQRREDDAKENSQAEKLKKCVIKPGLIMDREQAIEVISEFRKNGIAIVGIHNFMPYESITDERLINVASNLIELKALSEAGGE